MIRRNLGKMFNRDIRKVRILTIIRYDPFNLAEILKVLNCLLDQVNRQPHKPKSIKLK